MSKKSCLIDSQLSVEEQIDIFGGELKDDALAQMNSAVATEAIESAKYGADRQLAQTGANIKTLKFLRSYDGDNLQAITAMLVNDLRGKAEGINIERVALTLNNLSHTKMLDFMEAMEAEKFQLFKGVFTDADATPAQKAMMRDVVRSIFGGDATNPDAAKFGKQINKALDDAHNLHSRAGGQTDTLEGFGLPQKQDPLKVSKVSEEEWLNYTMTKLDIEGMKSRYGASDDDIREMVRQSYYSIVTDGASKIGSDPNTRISPKSLKKASDMHQNNRFLKFKDGDSWLDYQEKFGSGNVYMSITDHISNLSRETALMQRFGPDYEQGYAFAKAQAQQNIDSKGKTITDVSMRLNDSMFNEIKGWSGQRPHNLTHAINSIKSLEVASKLGGAFLSTFSDMAYSSLTKKFNGLSRELGFGQYLKQYTKGNRRFAAQMGLTAEYAISRTVSAFEYQTQMGASRARNAAEFVMRASNLTAHTIAARQAFGLEFNANVAAAVKHGWADMDPKLKKAFNRYGIIEADFEIMAKAKKTQRDGVEFIDPKDLPIEQQIKMVGMIGDETDFAVPTPGVRERVWVSLASDPNTVAGASARAGTQFMSFGTTIMTKHWGRAATEPNMQGKLAYAGYTLATTTMLGASVVAAKDIAAGREVNEDYLSSKEFWFKAMMQGGYLSFMGDILLKETGWDDMWSAPLTDGVIRDVMGVLVFGNLQKLMTGGYDDINISKDAIEFLRKNTPATNLWYTRLALERAVWDNLRTMADPDFKSNALRRERKMKREDGRGYWWRPNKSAPELMR